MIEVSPYLADHVAALLNTLHACEVSNIRAWLADPDLDAFDGLDIAETCDVFHALGYIGGYASATNSTLAQVVGFTHPYALET